MCSCVPATTMFEYSTMFCHLLSSISENKMTHATTPFDEENHNPTFADAITLCVTPLSLPCHASCDLAPLLLTQSPNVSLLHPPSTFINTITTTINVSITNHHG